MGYTFSRPRPHLRTIVKGGREIRYITAGMKSLFSNTRREWVGWGGGRGKEGVSVYYDNI